MIPFLICVAMAYLILAYLNASKTTGTSTINAFFRSPHIWAAMFTITTTFLVSTTDPLVWWTLGALSALLATLCLFCHSLENHGASFYQRLPSGSALLTLELPLLAIATLAGWHIWTTREPETHPVVRQAQARQQELMDSRMSMEVTLVRMHRYLDEFEIPVTESMYSLSQIQAMAKELIRLADKLIDEHSTLTKQHDEFLVQVVDAPEMFHHAGEIWRQYALEEQVLGDSGLAQQYLETAALWDAYAEGVKKERGGSFRLQELGEVMFFVERARLYLARLVANSPLQAGAEFLDNKSSFESNLRQFIGQFDELRTSIRGLTNQLHEAQEASPIYETPADAHMEAAIFSDSNSTQGIPRLIREIAASVD